MSIKPRSRLVLLLASTQKIAQNLYPELADRVLDRKSTRLNSSHSQISYAVFCLKKKKKLLVKFTLIQYAQTLSPSHITPYRRWFTILLSLCAQYRQIDTIPPICNPPDTSLTS